MEKAISLHISELLAQHDCVILPNFGAFLANNKQAAVDIRKDYFTPPMREISFNRSLRQHDGLLVHHHATRQGISYQASLEEILKLSAKMDYLLQENKEFTLPGIGTFVMTADQAIHFQSFENDLIHPAAYGLSAFHYRKIQRQQQKTILTPAVKKAVRRTLIYAPVGLLLAIVPFQLEKHSGELMSNLGLSPLISFGQKYQPVNYIEEAYSFEPSMPIPEHFFLEDAMLAIKLERERFIEASEMQYFIIAASWPGEKGASAHQQRLLAKGYDSRILKGENGRYRVSCAGYKSLQEAEKELKKYRKSIHPEAWILHASHR